MTRRHLCAAIFAAILLAGCDTTGAAPTSQPGGTNQPTAAVTQQPGSDTTYPVLPTADPNLVQTYPTPDTANQILPVNPAYPTPESGSGGRPTTVPTVTP